MFIQTEETPNPSTLKFMPGRDVITNLEKDFKTSFVLGDDLSPSPLAKSLMDIDGVVGVFLGADFITITKDMEFDWYVLKPSILGSIMEHFVNNQPVFATTNASVSNAEDDSNDDPIVVQIKELINTRVRPAVAQDGGDIIFDSFVDGVVYLTMHGACSGCPSSSATLKSGIENMLKFYIPEVLEVRPTNA